MRRALGVVAGLVAASGVGIAALSEAATAQSTASRVSLVASARQVEEGDRILLTARIKAPGKAVRVTLEKYEVPLYFGTPTWEPVKTMAVRGKRAVTFRAVATDLDSERYRAAVTYRGERRPSISRAAVVTVWRWIPLSNYQPYYETGYLGSRNLDINGVRYSGWGPAWYSDGPSWEARFTPGRHCKAFRAVVGVSDISDDGSSGTVSFTADDAVVYDSPVLKPGSATDVEVALAKPYRFGIQLTDTSPDPLGSWPGLGDPGFLCTGLG